MKHCFFLLITLILELSPIYPMNVKNRLLASSDLPHNSHSRSGLASRQWSLAPNANSEDPPCQNSDSSRSLGINVWCSVDMQGIEVIYGPPTAEEFVALRAATGMRERKVASAEKGIPNSLFWVTLRIDGRLIGMGRVVGDGGTVAQITDIAIVPEQQKKGYGTFIFDRIQEYILAEIPDDAFVCLFAEKEIAPFYESKGFKCSHERWPGMFWPCAERVKAKQ